MPTDKARWMTGDPAVIWTVIACVALALLLAVIALWPQLEHPIVLLVVIPAAAAAGAAIANAFRMASGEVEPQSAGERPKATRGGALNWQDIVAALPDPAIVVDKSSTIMHFNAASKDLFERLHRSVALEHANRDPELIEAVRIALERGETATARLAPRSGTDRHLVATVAPLALDGKEPTGGALITIRDLSEQQRLLEMRSDFIANASHELRTPLASVRGFIETLQGPARNDEAARKRFLTIMADQAERMTRLIDDLLLLSRVEEKANLRPTGSVVLEELIADVVRSLAPVVAERGAQITVAATTTPHVVRGDRDELFQVFQNLLENAVKYGRDNGRVEVEMNAGNTRSRYTVAIRDDGPGIAPEHLPRLTERFYRVNAEHSRNIGGTGLGLAIVKHVLSRHGGELHVESVIGNGTTFRVTLPVL